MIKSLYEAEVRYLPLEKAILVVVHTTHKLRHYFQSHTVVVLTQLPLRSLLRNDDYTGMIAALNQFISQSVDRCRPFFQLLNKWKGFEWTEECVLAF